VLPEIGVAMQCTAYLYVGVRVDEGAGVGVLMPTSWPLVTVLDWVKMLPEIGTVMHICRSV